MRCFYFALWSAVLAAKAVVLEAEQADELRELLEETKVIDR